MLPGMTTPPTQLGRLIRKDRAARIDSITKAKPESRRNQAIRWSLHTEGGLRLIENGKRPVRVSRAAVWARKLKTTKAKAAALIDGHNEYVAAQRLPLSASL